MFLTTQIVNSKHYLTFTYVKCELYEYELGNHNEFLTMFFILQLQVDGINASNGRWDMLSC